jgi:hypothetical protein
MSVAWVAAGIVAGVWLLVALFQLGDVATSFLDSRTARDRDIPGRIARERTNEVSWIIPVVAILALLIGLGLDHAGRLFFDTDDPALGSLFVLGIAVLVVGIGALALAAVAATDPISYSALRRQLREVEGERLTAAQVKTFRALLGRIDARTRSKSRPTRVLLTTASVLRLATVVVGILVIVAAAIAAAIDPTAQSASIVAISILAPVLNALFAALGIRFSLSSDTAWRRVYAHQRTEIIRLLEAFDRASRKGVAGLGDRVARALQILREQQTQ